MDADFSRKLKLTELLSRIAQNEPRASVICVDEFSSVDDETRDAADFIVLSNLSLPAQKSLVRRLQHHEAYVQIAFDIDSPMPFAVFMKTSHSPAAYATVAQAVETIAGYMSPLELKGLFDTVKSLPDDGVIVELGSLYGRSSAAMTFACLGTQRKVFCIDKFAEFQDLWANNIRRVRGHPHVVFVRGLTDQSLMNWQNIGGGRAIDFIFNDASHEYADTLREFQLAYPLVKPGGSMGFHDVVPSWPGSQWVWNHLASKALDEHRRIETLAIGRKRDVSLPTFSVPPADPGLRDLPIYFFTLALNAEPYIRRHIEVLKNLPFRWHWHIVEGVDEQGHGKRWIDEHTHEFILPRFSGGGLSNDGTSEYLDELVREYPDAVTIYRKPRGEHWMNILEMLNTPLANIDEECLLWQLDPEEIWNTEQIIVAREMFHADTSKSAAAYGSRCFVGDDLVASDVPEFANKEADQGFRTWRFRPGLCWFGPESPRLCEPQPDGELLILNTFNSISRETTRAKNLIFDSYVYATLKQITQKQAYFGLRHTVTGWHALQAAAVFPVNLRQFFLWIESDVLVNKIED